MRTRITPDGAHGRFKHELMTRKQTMDLILWRHAEAEEGLDDLARQLTDKGHQQAKLSARWLKKNLPADAQLWVSEAVRSQQTAAYLSKNSTIVPLLNPSISARRLPDLLRNQNAAGTLVWVGHQPWIGQLCAWLLNGHWQNESYWSVKKSGFWWFDLYLDEEGAPHAKLKAMLTPATLKTN